MAVDFMNTKFGDIDLVFIKNYLRIEQDMTEDDNELSLFIASMKNYIISYTQMTIEELNEASQINIPYILLIAEAYQNRSLTVDKVNVSPMYKMMIGNVRKLTI